MTCAFPKRLRHGVESKSEFKNHPLSYPEELENSSARKNERAPMRTGLFNSVPRKKVVRKFQLLESSLCRSLAVSGGQPGRQNLHFRSYDTTKMIEMGSVFSLLDSPAGPGEL